MSKGRKGKTKIVTTSGNKPGKKGKQQFKKMGTKRHASHKGHSMKAYRKAQMSYKKSKKR